MQEKERTFFPMRERVRVAGRILLSFFFYCHVLKNGILLPKLFWPTVRKKCSRDQEKHLKLESESQEF